MDRISTIWRAKSDSTAGGQSSGGEKRLLFWIFFCLCFVSVARLIFFFCSVLGLPDFFSDG